MGTYNKQAFLICLTIFFILQNCMSSMYFTWYLDWCCKVIFNYTMLEEDGMNRIYSDCYGNATKTEGGKNHTLAKTWNCYTKCYMLKSEMFEETGKLIPSKLTEYYEKYSNATSGYISNVAKVMSDCIGKAEEDLRNLTTSGEDVSDCKYFGLFDSCSRKQFFKLAYDNTTSPGFCREDAETVASTEAGDLAFFD